MSRYRHVGDYESKFLDMLDHKSQEDFLDEDIQKPKPKRTPKPKPIKYEYKGGVFHMP